MSRSNLAATWRLRVKLSLGMGAIAIAMGVIPNLVRSFYPNQGPVLDSLNDWLIIALIDTLVTFLILLLLRLKPVEPSPSPKRRRLALGVVAMASIVAGIWELVRLSGSWENKIGAAITTAILIAGWMGLVMYVLAPATGLRTTTTSTNQRQNV
jgi:hypothetical protein